MGEGAWELWDDAASLDTAAGGWTRLATALDDAGETLVAKSKDLLGTDWEGDDATSFAEHRTQLVGSVDTATKLAKKVSSTLTNMAGVVRVAQGNLDISWAKVSGIEHSGSPSGAVRWLPEDDAESAKVTTESQNAVGIREELDKSLEVDRAELAAAVGEWRAITATWRAVVEDGQDPFTLPEDVDGVGVITVDGQTFFNTGAGEDNVKITIDPRTGDQIVNINGTTYRVPKDQEIVIRTGADDDIVEVPQGTRVNVTILGGDGYDRLRGGDGHDRILAGDGDDEVDAGGGNDVVLGGRGRDYVDGQTGDDTLSGGEGDDTVYGLDGNDTLLGGRGQDFLEGGKNDDRLLGGEGKDILSGGRDDDTIVGGGGDDVSYAGHGNDTTYGGTGSDTSHEESGDDNADDVERTVTVEITDLARFIKIEGSPEFVARVEADLDLLRSSPNGQQMLAGLQREHDDSGFWGMGKENLTIREYPDNSNSTADPGNNDIDYSTRIDWIEGAPPVAVLYHEMAHVYDFMTGNYDDEHYTGNDTQNHGVEQGERTAVGLEVDHDHDPKTPEQLDPDHPFALTENGLREEMGAPRRDHY